MLPSMYKRGEPCRQLEGLLGRPGMHTAAYQVEMGAGSSDSILVAGCGRNNFRGMWKAQPTGKTRVNVQRTIRMGGESGLAIGTL